MDFLPEIVMPEPKPEPEPEPEPIDMESEEEEPDIEISGARDPVEEEIFKQVNFDDKPEVKEIVEEETTPQPEPVVQESEPKKKPKKPRKPPSQRQLEALAKNRERLRLKRLQTRRENELIQEEAKKIVRARKGKPEPKPPPEPKQEKIDVEGAIAKALQRHDESRKARKAEKKRRLKEEEEQKKLREAVQSAIQPGHNPTSNDPWASCFNIR